MRHQRNSIETPFLLVLWLLTPAVATAQVVEVTPSIGFRVGGELDGEIVVPLGSAEVDLEAGDSESYGLVIDIGITPNFQLELLLNRQESELLADPGFFREELPILDLDVDYYHVGALYQWTPGQLHPFVTASVGATRFNPDEAGLGQETRFSASLGAGVKIFLNRRLGARFEGRYFSTLLEADDDAFCRHSGPCHRHHDGEYFDQFLGSVGLILAF